MAVKVGNKYICNIPEAVSKLIEDVEALKDQTAGTEANVYKLIVGQAFDEDLFNKMKAGDIVIVSNLPFVVIKLENKIEGYYINSLGGAITYGTLLKIEWEREDILKLIADTKFVKDLSFIQADIKAKTLEQINANYSADIASFCNFEGGTATPIFCRVQQLNKSLHIIINGKIENNTENEIGDYGTTRIEIELPQSIAEKIYDWNGAKVSEIPTGNTVIAGVFALVQKTTSVNTVTLQNNVLMYLSNITVANKIAIQFARSSRMSISAGETMYFDARLELDLI